MEEFDLEDILQEEDIEGYEESTEDLELEELFFPQEADTSEAEEALATMEVIIDELTENLSSEEQDAYKAEWVGALLSAIPAIVSAAPSIVRGVKSLIGNRSRRAPVRSRVASPHNTRPTTNRAAGSASQLLSLLRNPNVLNAISNAVTGGSGQLRVGNRSIPVGAILNAITQLSTQASYELEDEGTYGSSEYLMDTNGEFTVDQGSPLERAEYVADLLTQNY